MGDIEGTFWRDEENPEGPVSSEATGVKLGGSVRVLEGACFA